MNRWWIGPVLSLAGVSWLAACSPLAEEASDETAGPTPTGNLAKIVLPDGSECRHAGQGATLAYQGKRLTYTCSETTGLIGEVVIANGTEITLEKATLSGAAITGSTAETFTLNGIELVDGTICLHAGQGATLAFDGKRLNYTCNGAAAGLIGDISQTNGVFVVELATLDGTTLAASELVEIVSLSAIALQ